MQVLLIVGTLAPSLYLCACSICNAFQDTVYRHEAISGADHSFPALKVSSTTTCCIILMCLLLALKMQVVAEMLETNM